MANCFSAAAVNLTVHTEAALHFRKSMSSATPLAESQYGLIIIRLLKKLGHSLTHQCRFGLARTPRFAFQRGLKLGSQFDFHHNQPHDKEHFNIREPESENS